MSATVHIPSSGGGIVVDSGQPCEEAEVVTSGSNLTGSVINLATNEIIATPQIIKLVSSSGGGVGDDAETSTEISTGNYRPQLMNSQSGSKVHVISNVTLVTKSQATQQAINLVNTTSKSISSANSGYINAFVSKSIPPSGKIVNLVNPMKSQGGGGAAGGGQKPLVQKVSVPRNVQVLTRVQTLTHATLGGNIIMSRLATSQPQHFQPTSKQTTTVKAGTATGYNSVAQKAPKMVTGTQQMFPQGMKIYTGNVGGGQKMAPGVKTVKTVATPIRGPPSNQMTTNKMKQVFSSATAPNLTTIAQQYPSMGKSGGVHIQSTLNNNAVPVKFNSLMGSQTAQPGTRTVSSVGNLVIQQSGGQKMMKSSNKVIQVHHNSAPQTQHNQVKMVQNTTPQFNIIQGGTIKYVNAQGNVTQPPAPKLRSSIQNTGIINSTSHQATYGNQEGNADVIGNTESDLTYVNGMSMDEEISARILQSLSQKAVYNNNRYIQQQKYLISSPNTDTSAPTVYGGQYQSQEGKHGPEYFRVNTSDLQTTTTTFIDNIPLVATNEELYQHDPSYDQDEYTDGEEQITAKDTKLIMQHPALQDHTYAAPMPEGMANQETTQTENFQNTSANSTETSLAHILMGYSCNQQRQDDDNNSVISNDSRCGKNALENDLGEETETAPEGEGEDDSVTRCICDLTHDDGYMICCDKCSAWQHVDCMGIDRQNIPDEYNCEVCQPRVVDKNRARSLQLIKRKEQQALMMLNTLPQQTIAIDSNNSVVQPPTDQQQRPPALNNLSPTVKKSRSLGRKKSASEGFVGKRQKRDSRANGKRKETKKVSKRKSKQQSSTAENGGVNKSVMGGLRTWIENYEQAVTNHYSPELRARLQALGKQQSHQQLNSQTVNLRNVGNLDGRCGTVPHAGGKILISSLEMSPNTPIVEIRGKYMLSGQYKQQLLTSTRINRSPGPFIFFYRLPNDGPEICVDTRTYGNEARFVRRSCRPNAEVVHFIEKGTIHLYIVSMLNIKESTEITIRHEPHDLIGVGQGSAPAPTSTVCACGLTKDCLFPSTGATPILPQVNTAKTSKRVNGNYHVKAKEGGYKRSKTSFSRNRSTSSSGESNVGMLSPNGQVFMPTQISTTALAPPSIQPQLLEAAAAALSSPQASLPPTVTQMMNQYPPSPTRNQLNLSTASSATTMSIPGTPTLLSPNTETKENVVAAALSPIHPVIVPEVVPPPPPVQIPAPQPPIIPIPETVPTAPKPAPPKRLAKQKSMSLSEEEKVKEKPEEKQQMSKESTEARKLTREERKMEAIMKAFEKMEKTSQRKQELKQKTGSGGSSGGTVTSSGSVTRRRNSFSPFVKVKEEEEKKQLNNHQRKKKRKGSKSYQQVTSQRKRRRSRVNSNESDNGTSEESAMLSPPIPGASLYRNSEPVKAPPDDAAGMLLALARTPVEEVKEETDVGAFHSSLSSVCMLVEAAVAPLENQCNESDFKLPPKTKTKKTIMNEWLNQADGGYQGSELFGGAGASPGKNLETLVQAAVSMGTQQPHYRGRIQEEPQNLSMMAKKVEEFITLNDGGCDEEVVRSQEETVVLVPPPLPTPPMVGGSESAVKKRWLRQAISEECLDEMVPSPPNGFMTPLKKRRLARQCSDMVEDLSPTQVGFFPTAQPEVLETPESVDVKPIEVKSEVMAEEEDQQEIQEVIEVKKEEVEEEIKPPQNDIKEEIQPEEFDIEPLVPEKLEEINAKEDDGNLADIEDVNSDEIADLQKKIHSFHAENILILKSRNRKVKQRVDSEELTEKKSSLKIKKKRQSSDEGEILEKIKIKSRSNSISPPRNPVKVESPEQESIEAPPAPIIHPQGLPIELPVNFNSSIPPPSTSVTAYSSYLLNNASNLMTNIPPPSSFGLPAMFSNFPPPQLTTSGPPPPPPALSEYLENKSTTFRDIFTPTAPAYFATLNPPQPVPPPVVPAPAPTGFLTKSSSFTSLDPIPSAVTPTPAPRVYTRTASADPRLNPNISVPEPPPVPKRKLSITEYRKRKQQSTDCTSTGDSKPMTPEGDAGKDQDGEFINVKNVDVLSDCKDDSSSSASATKTPSTPEENVPFSPTPTLLELQQESLSERLKSYKSLQELSNTLPAREFFNSKTGAGTFTESQQNVSSTTCDAVVTSTVVDLKDTTECEEKSEGGGEAITTTTTASCESGGAAIVEGIVQKETVP